MEMHEENHGFLATFRPCDLCGNITLVEFEEALTLPENQGLFCSYCEEVTSPENV